MKIYLTFLHKQPVPGIDVRPRQKAVQHRGKFQTFVPTSYERIFWARVRFLSLVQISSDYGQSITGQVTEVTCPVIGWAQSQPLLRARDRKHAQVLEGRHYSDVMMGAMTSQITSLTIVSSTVYSGEDQRKHQSSASLAFVWGIHRWPVNSSHKWPVTGKMFPFDDVIMYNINRNETSPKFQFCCCHLSWRKPSLS